MQQPGTDDAADDSELDDDALLAMAATQAPGQHQQSEMQQYATVP